MNKPFDPSDYNRHDKTGKSVAAYLFSKNFPELKLVENVKKNGEDARGADFLVFKGEVHVGWLECGRKTFFKNWDFPGQTLQIEDRKGRYLNLPLPVVYCYVNMLGNRAIACNDSALRACPKTYIKNKHNPDGTEWFYVVDLSETYFLQ